MSPSYSALPTSEKFEMADDSSPPSFSIRTLFESRRAKLISLFTFGVLAILAISAFHPAARRALTKPTDDFHQPSSPGEDIQLYQESDPIDRPRWLVATMSPYFAIQRRTVIRETWQKLYRNTSTTEMKFVLANPDPDWDDIIAAENATHGDIIILHHLDENAKTANTIKTVEFFKHLTLNEEQTKRWTFISKVDDDSYLDAKTFYNQYLQPLMTYNSSVVMLDEDIPTVPAIVIGKKLHLPDANFDYPSGQFYTVSWDMATLMSTMQLKLNITTDEDVLVGKLLSLSEVPYTLIKLPYWEAHEIQWTGVKVDGRDTVWADEKMNLNTWTHPIGPSSINPHRMKDDKGYMMVAACYGPDGPRKPPSKFVEVLDEEVGKEVGEEKAQRL
ncbi:hypothetical protein BLS_007312 [Venturia inaequalis]|uniref:Hexosyltransferase n=1 Tax=Venturia inaequalis TaxID=5025 RepID=A0A8H3UPQ1_VENIN|nr:hypothetical protein BLS_007312 [Venturia inaequalis]KAE9972514.1 hypothetical protein EG328_004940 [Venturia inaequalis]KAE9991223.1 hypothetical protein EG327_000278 [Venturia inaequalis]